MKKPCKTYRPVLDAILDGVEAQASRAGLEAHASECATCRHALDESLAVRSALDTLVDGQTTRVDDVAFVDSVFEEVDRGAAAREIACTDSAGPSTEAARGWRLVLLGSAAAAAAVLAMQLRQPTSDKPNRTSDDGQSAGAEERRSSQRPQIAPLEEPKELGPRAAPEMPAEVVPAPLTAEEIDGFRIALIEGAEATEFDPTAQDGSADFVAAIASPLRDPRRAARKILTSTEELPWAAALAARFLGPRADARDRVLLKRSILSIGEASAWALVDRGEPGIAALWAVGLQEADSDGSQGAAPTPADTARSTLFAAAKAGRMDLKRLPHARGDAALAASVINAGAGDPAARLLESFLESGETPWLDAWAENVGALASLSPVLDATRGARISDRRAKRLLQAIERSRAESGVPFVLRALESDIEESALALAAIQGQTPVQALLRTTLSGSLRDSMEEAAWRAMVRSGSERVLAATLGTRSGATGRAETLLGALVRGAGEELHPEEQRVLSGLSASREVYSEARSGALLLLAETCGRGGVELLPEVSKSAQDLRSDPDAMVSAAAWLVPTQVPGAVPPHVAAVLSRGSSLTVKHARLTRAIEKARTRLASGSS